MNLESSSSTPLLLCILDGVGYNPDSLGNAVALAKTPTLEKLRRTVPWTLLATHGELVGLPAGQMGNSEVGHLTIGAGRTIRQWLTRVTAELADGTAQASAQWREFVKPADTRSSRVHVVGLYSTGGVHSHSEHLHSAVAALVNAGISEICLHLISDGRDVAPHSFRTDLEHLISRQPREAQITSIIGRYYSMDRDQRTERTAAAYALLTNDKPTEPRSPLEWVASQYEAGITDEFLPAARFSAKTIAREDRVLFFNFRADRMRQLSAALTSSAEIDGFERPVRIAPANALCFTEYDAELKLPVLFPPISVANTLGDLVSAAGMRQLHCAETEKYPHVTYFFNGGRETILKGEDRILVPSPRDVATYDLKPEMSAAELTAAIISHWEANGIPPLTVVNFANGDMVGHTGSLTAATQAIQTVDGCLERLLTRLAAGEGRAFVFADHGNAELMIDYDTHMPCTTHTKFLVPFYAVGFPPATTLRCGGSLRDVAPSALKVLGLKAPAEMTGSALF